MKIEMTHIAKSFGSNQVLKDINLTLNSGEVHALMGENGAGKSTLMNVLTGLFPATGGQISIDGETKSFANPKEAELFGISFIHQEMNSWPDMTVLENLFLGREIKRAGGLLNNKEMKARAKDAFKQLGVNIPLDTLIGTLSVGQQQMIEIAKSFLANLKILIMDEPTAALTERETNRLFAVIETLKTKGVGIVYISHRMEEIFKVSQFVTVMRDGQIIDTKPTAETNVDELVRKMVGREITDYYPRKDTPIGDVIFSVSHLNSAGGLFEDISFEVRAGEILAFSGLMGAGRTEVMRAIFGIDKLKSGTVTLNGKQLRIRKPVDAIRHGIGFLTEDRKTEGLILDFSIRENVVLPKKDSFVRRGLYNAKAAAIFVRDLINRLSVKATSDEQLVSDLSGGNQQKVVMAKWVGISPKVLILDEPTRGVDVGAKREIYELMNELAGRGVAIVMVSSDLPEVLGISDRIIVMHEGTIAGQLPGKGATQEQVMQLATLGE
ncbi:sugar ABC transporter ATP-binding protein [Bifidobacterium psychraerophilum]|jgi:ribose transport system ATP-binding protein|uniref:sugar ABC transporter ATP-binding protein n=1 Tax=Bifidobacterium psychraerophilum TaxID=218140 RepID=UPI0023F12C8A|nr:sugar ABC transporter ATP-binding protein [Bifidobacterium psychraerophilum]MCI1660259.1 sugar ABC transporter ATP-binding protein [Bifidobacterium psychraerophilum]MCI1803930.1 sugar ABC transporter ATP-binding protein [Bifidobacterium psychraerophilum]MCI2175772.1 sugar ABC transporter ATP-binding protein [Bifidobacterium psychraerophilum]MCI2182501.1 sugar ABC transporter ATP-binding protein [Bifidobacterium psychraerophilum]